MRRLNWYIARHYLRAGRGRGFLSLITWIALGGVIVGVAALIIVLAVMSGMQEDLRNKILESSPHVVVLERGTSLRLQNYREIVDSILGSPDVVAAAPFALSRAGATRSPPISTGSKSTPPEPRRPRWSGEFSRAR
jgi:lipoprotein-releasing system permease protein